MLFSEEEPAALNLHAADQQELDVVFLYSAE